MTISMQLKGSLFTYYEPKVLTAFETGPDNASSSLVVIGGLGDGYNSLPFVPALVQSMAAIGWSVIQVQLSSSYTGFGIVDLQTDSKELDHLVRYLTKERHKENLVFLGHSTGSQDCYWHNKYGETSAQVLGYILQGPVSDRESYAEQVPNLQEYVEMAKEMRERGNGRDIMPRGNGFDPIPITADRYFSLVGFGGDDDVFSTDMPDDMIQQLYQGIKRPMAMIESENDEYYASKMDKMEFLSRLQSFCPAIKKIGKIKNDKHKVETIEGQQYLAAFALEFVQELLSNK
ncbi:hypothetical protein BJV82DRAFT_709215 [Fennellomyces sp. T-0311]|nr:hypothetical protein BJV82DRAFT_709215 [Fennellomyces sp. T-0311]